MLTRADVLCGQINLQKGITGTINLLSYLEANLQTGPKTQNLAITGDGGGGGNEGSLQKKPLYNAFLYFLQEPPVKDGKVVGFGRRNQVFQANSRDRPRAAIYASRNLNLWLVNEFCSQDIVTCLWKRKEEEDVYVISAYLDINLTEVFPKMLEDLLMLAERQRKDVILCTDANAHSSMWNSEDTNKRGETMEELILSHNLTVQNNGDHFTFYRAQARTIIDVTMTRGRVSSSIANWHV